MIRELMSFKNIILIMIISIFICGGILKLNYISIVKIIKNHIYSLAKNEGGKLRIFPILLYDVEPILLGIYAAALHSVTLNIINIITIVISIITAMLFTLLTVIIDTRGRLLEHKEINSIKII